VPRLTISHRLTRIGQAVLAYPLCAGIHAKFLVSMLPARVIQRQGAVAPARHWSNFAKTGDPNSVGLPPWTAYSAESYQVLHLDTNPQALPDDHRARYLFIDQLH
jgi:carboxylesterase type B